MYFLDKVISQVVRLYQNFMRYRMHAEALKIDRLMTEEEFLRRRIIDTVSDWHSKNDLLRFAKSEKKREILRTAIDDDEQYIIICDAARNNIRKQLGKPVYQAHRFCARRRQMRLSLSH